MPSAEPLPTVRQLLRAFEGEVSGRREDADTHRGAMYDHLSGVGALMFRRVAERDRDEFRAIYFSTAENAALEQIVEQRLDRQRVQSAGGTGFVDLTRATAAAGEGTFWRGTQISVAAAGVMPARLYRVREDRFVPATATTARVPIEAVLAGREGYVVGTPSTLPRLRIDDPLWDNTWTISAIECSEGTLREQDHELRAATRQDRIDARVGYAKAVTDACVDAGAAEVALFAGNWLGDANDTGLNRVYVGDQSFETTEALLKACRFAMIAAGMAGANIQILAMAKSLLTLTLVVTLWERAANPEQQAEWVRSAVIEYFQTRENPFTWREDGVRAAAMRALTGVTSVDITPSSPEPTLSTLFDTQPLPRFHVEPWTVRVTVQGPE